MSPRAPEKKQPSRSQVEQWRVSLLQQQWGSICEELALQETPSFDNAREVWEWVKNIKDGGYLPSQLARSLSELAGRICVLSLRGDNVTFEGVYFPPGDSPQDEVIKEGIEEIPIPEDMDKVLQQILKSKPFRHIIFITYKREKAIHRLSQVIVITDDEVVIYQLPFVKDVEPTPETSAPQEPIYQLSKLVDIAVQALQFYFNKCLSGIRTLGVSSS